MNTCRHGILVALVVVALPAVASAAPSKPLTPRDAALELFEESTRAYRNGDFRGAAATLRRAYAVYPEPLLLFNLGRALEGSEQIEQAVEAYEQYLKVAPKAPNAVTTQQHVRALRRIIEDRRELSARRAAPPPITPAPGLVGITGAAGPPRRPFLKRHWWIFPVGAVVLAGAGVGLYFGLRPRPCQSATIGCLEY